MIPMQQTYRTPALHLQGLVAITSQETVCNRSLYSNQNEDMQLLRKEIIF